MDTAERLKRREKAKEKVFIRLSVEGDVGGQAKEENEESHSTIGPAAVMPSWYYHRIYHTCLWLADFSQLERIADRMIHTIPFNVRFKVA
jgi:hypothetical protein